MRKEKNEEFPVTQTTQPQLLKNFIKISFQIWRCHQFDPKDGGAGDDPYFRWLVIGQFPVPSGFTKALWLTESLS